MDQNKARMTYPDFKMTPSGMQFKDAVVGEGPLPEQGDRVVLDWSGYTIGYNGRPFEMRAMYIPTKGDKAIHQAQ